MNKPSISVVMSVYNGEKFIEENMNSILNQSFTDFELIVIDDCSKDNTPEILKGYAARDGRVRILHNEKNMRLQASLNRGIDEATGEYIVRVDADDVCRYDRFERQYNFMRSHPELDMSACKYYLYIDGKIVTCPMIQRIDEDSVAALLLSFNPICHPCVIIKTGVAREMRYREEYTCSEDLELWTRMVAEGRKIAIQRDRMMLYRQHESQITANSSEAQIVQYKKIIYEFYKRLLFELTDDELDFLTEGIYFRNKPDAERLASFMKKVQAENSRTRAFDKNDISYVFLEALLAYKRCGIDIKKQLFELGPVFLTGEIIKRIYERLNERIKRRNVVRKFTDKGRGGI